MIAWLPAALTALLIALTWLATQGALPDPARHERTLDALRAVHLNNAALDRDVLRARAGLLRNYDPLVAHIDSLRAAVATLREHGQPNEIRAHTEAIGVEVSEAEQLVDAFKSANALLQNSLSYFDHTTQELARFAAAEPEALATTGALASAMLRFLNTPRDENAADVRRALDSIASQQLPAALRERAQALVAHGGIILTTLPTVDETMRRLLAPALADQARALQDAYLEQHGRLAARAGRFRLLLYGLSIALAFYLAYLFIRLRQRAREREGLEARLQQAQRLEAIGTLAGGIAHEFNNVLGGIMGHAELAANALPPGARPRRHIDQVLGAGRRAQDIIDQILAFGRRSERRHRVTSIEPAVTEALELLRVSLPATIRLRRRLTAAGAAIRGDRTQMQQVVLNLCTNAAHASDGRGTIDVSLDCVDLVDERALSHGQLAPGPYVRLSVQDRGHGIDAATMARIFEPFFTTKAVGAGTGLGLSAVHGIVQQHGGGLNVRSRPREGSTFEVYFPRLAEGTAEPAGTAPLARGNGEAILLVDDKKALVRLGEEMLAALGYEPVGFDSSPAALAAFRADPRRFDLVLTDEVMPAMSGTQLAAALQELRPGLPIVIMTGGSSPLEAARLRAAGVREVLKKPLLSADLARCLGEILAPARAAG